MKKKTYMKPSTTVVRLQFQQPLLIDSTESLPQKIGDGELLWEDPLGSFGENEEIA